MVFINTVDWFIEKVILGYIFSSLIFLLLILFFKNLRKKTETYLGFSNLLILFALLANLISLFCKIIVNHRMEALALAEGSGTVPSYFLIDRPFHILWVFSFGFIYHLLFLFKYNRIKIVQTIVSVLLLFLLVNEMDGLVLITSTHRDYLPANWSFYFDIVDTAWTTAFSSAYFLICWYWASKKSKA